MQCSQGWCTRTTSFPPITFQQSQSREGIDPCSLPLKHLLWGPCSPILQWHCHIHCGIILDRVQNVAFSIISPLELLLAACKMTWEGSSKVFLVIPVIQTAYREERWCACCQISNDVPNADNHRWFINLAIDEVIVLHQDWLKTKGLFELRQSSLFMILRISASEAHQQYVYWI